MFFDTLAGIVERHLPEMVDTMLKARIFRTEPKIATSDGSSDPVSRWLPDERTIENFRTPFPVIAIESAPARNAAGNRCTILTCKSAKQREFDFICAEKSEDGAYIGAGSIIALPDAEQIIDLGDYQHVARMTSIMRMWKGSKKAGVKPLGSRLDIKASMQISKSKASLATVNIDEMTVEQRQELAAQLHMHIDDHRATTCFLSCCFGILSVLAINEPASFIVEERPLVEPYKTQSRIPRSADRPQFIVLKPRQIRTRFMDHNKSEDDTENDMMIKRTPHERRGHYRLLQSERYTKARGQVLWIDPVWIGPSDFSKGPNRYIVRLDL